MLDELTPHLTQQRLRDLESRLRIQNDHTVPAEWEIAVGYALSKVGKIVDPGENRPGNPDYIFTPSGTSTDILIEVTALSDQSAEDENPVSLFIERMTATARKAGIDHKIGAFSWSLGDKESDGKIILGLPRKRDIDKFFRSREFTAFLDEVKRSPEKPHRFDFQDRGINSAIAFTPGPNRYASGSHRSYKVALTLEDPTVFHRLKNKERQLKKAGFDLPAIVFLCDNDSHILRHDSLNGNEIDGVVLTFLNGRPHKQLGPWVIQHEIPKQGRRIDAVATLTVHHPYEVMTGFAKSRRELRGRFLPADHCDEIIRSEGLLQTINLAISQLPTPVSTPNNAMRKYRLPAFYGGGEMGFNDGCNYVKLSLLTVQKLLSGEISYEEFSRDHAELAELIRKMNTNGQMISKINIERLQDQDDDWITMAFDGIQPNWLFKERP